MLVTYVDDVTEVVGISWIIMHRALHITEIQEGGKVLDVNPTRNILSQTTVFE